MDRFAVLSDIHGNRWALEAVLHDLRRRAAAHVMNLGDIVYGPLAPEHTADLLVSLDIPATTIRGNEDRILFETDADSSSHPSLGFVVTEVSRSTLNWLEQFPSKTALEDIVLVHGTPEDDEEYLLEAVEEWGTRLRRAEEIRRILEGEEARLVLCGHSHLPRSVQVPDGPLVVNPGSVGLPAFADDKPFPHVIETGSPHARYAMVERKGADWNVELIALAYDWETAARAAARNGRQDWAHALRTGFSWK